MEGAAVIYNLRGLFAGQALSRPETGFCGPLGYSSRSEARGGSMKARLEKVLAEPGWCQKGKGGAQASGLTGEKRGDQPE